MDRIIVYADSAEYAQRQLQPMLVGGGRTQWLVVACAPRMTRRINKWVSHSARENWRTKWSEKLFAELVPVLQARGDKVLTVLAKGPLTELTEQLMAEHGPARVFDARRPKLGHDLAPVTQGQPADTEQGRWTVPGAVVGLGTVLVLAAE